MMFGELVDTVAPDWILPGRDIPTSAPMSAFGTKRTFQRAQSMSAFGGKADIQLILFDVWLLTQSGYFKQAVRMPTRHNKHAI